MTEIRIIDESHWEDIRLPNEPFRIFGRMIPCYENERWGYSVVHYPPEEITETCFPDYPYDFDAERETAVFIGAYDGDCCVGLAVLREGMFRYLYLDDLKVCADARDKGVGKLLVEKCGEIARERGKLGVYTIGQDNNLAACLFYLRCGFEIGGFDNRVYRGTAQEDKADIIFYLDT